MAWLKITAPLRTLGENAALTMRLIIIAVLVVGLVITLAAAVGYGLNIWDILFHTEPLGFTILRVVGVFAIPLGSVLGLFF